MAKNKTFKPGQSTYTCHVCTKVTRDVSGEGSTELCAECFDEAGLENEHFDGYHDADQEGPNDHCPHCQDSSCIKCGADTMHLVDSLCRRCAPERFTTKGHRTTRKPTTEEVAPAAPATKEDINMSIAKTLNSMKIKDLVALHNAHVSKSVKGFGSKPKAIAAIQKKVDADELAVALGLKTAKGKTKKTKATSGRRNVRAGDSIQWVAPEEVKLAGPLEFKRLFGRRTKPFNVGEARDEFIAEAQMPRTKKDRNPMHWQQTLHRMRKEGWIEIVPEDA